jgi:hypothetical protein
LHLVDGLSLLRPEEQVFTAMLDGWRNQQLARNLAFSTINGREKAVQAFARHADALPWNWTSALVDEWLGDRRAVGNLKRSTLRNYQEAVRSFCSYIINPAYQWSVECEQRFGTHPVQVVHEWNTAVHVADAEADAGKRAFTRKELTALFDHADEQVDRIRSRGPQGLASGVSGRGAAQDRLRVRAAAQRDPDAGHRRLRAQPRRPGVR